MENLNLHKQRLVTILIGALGLIFLFLPWLKVQSFGGSASHMGYNIWGGIITAIAFAAAIASSLLLGDKTKPFDKQGKLIAIIAFAVAFLFTLIVLIASSGSGQQTAGFYVIEVKKSPGIGVWLTLVLELGGLAWVTGVLDKLAQHNAAAAGSAPPPTPPNPPAPPTPPQS